MSPNVGDDGSAKEYFETRAKSVGSDHFAVDWSESSQRASFNDFLKAVDVRCKSLLDYGCGTGALLDHLPEEFERENYVGVDFSEAMIVRAKRNHPDSSFIVGGQDVLGGLKPVEVVAAIGTFNIDYHDIELGVESTLAVLFEKCTFACYASFTIRNPEVSFASHVKAWDPVTLEAMAYALSPKVRIGRHYLPHHMSICLFRDWQGSSGVGA